MAIERSSKRNIACKMVDIRRFCVSMKPSVAYDWFITDSKETPQLARLCREFEVIKELKHVSIRYTSPKHELTLRQPNIVAIEKVFLSSSTM
jgi:hypothetical protein